jgi:RNA 2',3'-cyclic 3'-phosphodiesterase
MSFKCNIRFLPPQWEKSHKLLQINGARCAVRPRYAILSAPMRLFVAVLLPSGFEDALADIKRQIGRHLDLRWTPAENLHLTLKFLGDVADDRVNEVGAGLRDALSPVPAFDVVLAGLGAFPSPSRPRVVWVGAREGRRTLTALAERVESALEPLGFSRESRPYEAHLTLARARAARPVKDLSHWKKLENVELGRFTVDRVCLMRSRLHPQGAEHTVLEPYTLSNSDSNSPASEGPKA